MTENDSRRREALALRRLDERAGTQTEKLRAHIVRNGDPVENRVAEKKNPETSAAIPGHEAEYEHSEGHGHYEHDQHGNDMNAGGGIVSFE